EGVGATAAALVDLSTVAGNKISNPPWVKFQSAGWVNFPSAPTAELLPERDPGTGESALLCRLQARIMVPPGADRQAVSIACGIVRTLREQTWNLSLEPARFVRSAVDGSREELKSLRVWLVEWTQSLRLGDPEWAWEDQPPGSLMLGFDPQTGPGHEPDYFAPEALA
ncbi:hypothetical protein ABZR62_30945, partial [Pseudomonas aeruginosa]